MEDQHPITPPPELVQQWWKSTPVQIQATDPDPIQLIATQAARWGADQELEACEAWIRSSLNGMLRPANRIADDLRAARRPKPPSLKEQALDELDHIPTHDNEGRTLGVDVSIIRRALEQLP